MTLREQDTFVQNHTTISDVVNADVSGDRPLAVFNRETLKGDYDGLAHYLTKYIEKSGFEGYAFGHEELTDVREWLSRQDATELTITALNQIIEDMEGLVESGVEAPPCLCVITPEHALPTGPHLDDTNKIVCSYAGPTSIGYKEQFLHKELFNDISQEEPARRPSANSAQFNYPLHAITKHAAGYGIRNKYPFYHGSPEHGNGVRLLLLAHGPS